MTHQYLRFCEGATILYGVPFIVDDTCEAAVEITLHIFPKNQTVFVVRRSISLVLFKLLNLR